MSIIYKLVGVPVNSDTKTELKHKDWDESKKEINLSDVQNYFQSMGCSGSCDVLKFITDSETMKTEKSYQLNKDNRFIFVFTMDKEVKSKLVNIFDEHGYVAEKKEIQTVTRQTQKVDETLSKPIPLDEIKISETVIQEPNNETIKLFQEEDFCSLLRIYSENPDIFKRFASYVSSGDVVLTEDRFNVPGDINVDSQLEEIKKLGIDLSDEIIIDALKKFKGHLNLTLRFLLYNKTAAV